MACGRRSGGRTTTGPGGWSSPARNTAARPRPLGASECGAWAARSRSVSMSRPARSAAPPPPPAAARIERSLGPAAPAGRRPDGYRHIRRKITSLEEQHARRPDRRRAAEPRQDELPDQRLDLKQQKRRQQRRRGKGPGRPGGRGTQLRWRRLTCDLNSKKPRIKHGLNTEVSCRVGPDRRASAGPPCVQLLSRMAGRLAGLACPTLRLVPPYAEIRAQSVFHPRLNKCSRLRGRRTSIRAPSRDSFRSSRS